jgi:hypothetical protein
LKTTATLTLLVSGMLLLTAGCAGVSQEGPATLAEAKAMAAERNVPILIDFYTDW